MIQEAFLSKSFEGGIVRLISKYLESYAKTRSEMKSLIDTRLKNRPFNMTITWMNLLYKILPIQ